MNPLNTFKHFADYLDLNKTERKGMLVLSVIILIVIIVRIYYPGWNVSNSLCSSLSAYSGNLDSLSKFFTSVRPDSGYGASDSASYNINQKIKPFPFNPNNFDVENWMELGLSLKQAQMIKRYEAGGGKFYCKEDVKKLWCISPEEYKILEPYIQLPSKSDSTYSKYRPGSGFKKRQVEIKEINTSSEEELMTIPGIGPYFASQIVRYRKKLGGYSHVEQLLEIKKIDSSVYSKISPYLLVNVAVIKKIDINYISLEDLRLHPYFTYNISLALINYREKHGLFKKPEDVRNCDLITSEVYNKILPYIKISDGN